MTAGDSLPDGIHTAVEALSREDNDLLDDDDTVDPLLLAYMAEGRQIFEDLGLDYLPPLIERGLAS